MKFVEKRERKQKDGYINRTEHKTYKWIWLRTYPFFWLPPAGRKKAHNFFETACHNHSPLLLLVSFFCFFVDVIKPENPYFASHPGRWFLFRVWVSRWDSVNITLAPVFMCFFWLPPFFMLPPFFCFYASTQLALQEQQERSHDVVKVQGEDPATPGPLTSKMTPGP